jgi:DNA-directed RNA polymerase subunit beta'
MTKLFEARRPKEPAVITEIDGASSTGDVAKRHRKIYMTGGRQAAARVPAARGAHINVQEGDKHNEVITRQMMRWVKIEEVGDSDFLIDEVVMDRFKFVAENDRIVDQGKRPVTGRPLLLGVPRPRSRQTPSFRPPASRRRGACSARRRSAASSTICAASRRKVIPG